MPPFLFCILNTLIIDPGKCGS